MVFDQEQQVMTSFYLFHVGKYSTIQLKILGYFQLYSEIGKI